MQLSLCKAVSIRQLHVRALCVSPMLIKSL